MFSLIPQIILLLCFGLIIWLIIKNLPKIKDEEGKAEHNIEGESSLNKKRKFIHRIPIEKIDAKVNGFLEKALRRSRIILMRIDTYLQKHLDTLKSHSKPKSIFKGDDSLIVKEEINIDNIQQDEFKDLEGDVDLIAGVDKSIDELLPKQEKTVNLDDKVDVLIVGNEDVVKKFDLEPNVIEVVVQKKKVTRRPRKAKVTPQPQKASEERNEEL
ncbi:MAG TPA: hypothetical protein PLQ44_00450 [Candidatus Paceibacterota bacterium]|nr:hypothetical protein [Candidatus Paceibacterota bacterium]HPT40068.1 hypothetical protein [Candidatus Paceibacterota bacterium]